MQPSARAVEIGGKVEAFVRDVIAPYERDPRCGVHDPSDELVDEMKALARSAGVLTPHILAGGGHLTQLETAYVLRLSGLSPLGPLAVNTMAPDEGNMYLLGKVASAEQKKRFLDPLVKGTARSAFFMTEPASEGGCARSVTGAAYRTASNRSGKMYFRSLVYRREQPGGRRCGLPHRDAAAQMGRKAA